MTYTYEYPRPALTVDAVVIRKHQQGVKILLIQRDNPPFEGMWALPGGFVGMDESLEEAVERELEEETGLKGIELEQLSTFGALFRDPRGRTISVVYYGWLEDEQKIMAGDDARRVAWYAPEDLPQLAFDHHDILVMALEKISKNSREKMI